MSVKDLKEKIQQLEGDLQYEIALRNMYKMKLEECERYARPFREQETQRARKAVETINATPEGKAMLNAMFGPRKPRRATRKSR